MSEVVDYLAGEYGWSSSVPNLSGKLKRGSLRYGEAVELADALGYPVFAEWCGPPQIAGCVPFGVSVPGGVPQADCCGI